MVSITNHKNFSLEYFSNEIIPDESFPDYGIKY